LVGWLSGFRAQTGSAAYWSYATFFRRLDEAATPGGEECRPCTNFASNTLPFALQLRKITENLSQGNRMALGCSAPNAIRLVDLAIAGDDFDWAAATCRPWFSRQATGSTLGQFQYLPSCRTREGWDEIMTVGVVSYMLLCWWWGEVVFAGLVSLTSSSYPSPYSLHSSELFVSA